MKRIAVLGAGLVGSLVARELAADGRFEVTALDRDEAALAPLVSLPRLEARRADLGAPADVARVAAGADVVVGALPGALGHSVLKGALEAKRPVADIAFAPEDALALDGLAKGAGVPAIVDIGVSPGLSNLAAGRAEGLLDETDSIRIYVGGLPFRRVKPWEYRIVFSAADVIEEYTREARIRENGKTVSKPALSDVEEIDFPEVGTLEGFNTDGLRTLLETSKAKSISEKTLRYPGHAALMRAFRDAGFFSNEPVEAGGVRLAPRVLTERLLFSAWKRPAGEAEFTLLRVVCEGRKGGRRAALTYDLIDRTDPKTGATSMARTTGFPCAIVAGWLAEGRVSEPGIFPPELLGRHADLWDEMVAGLAARGVRLTERITEAPWPS
ncbi:MAG: saccharopine dehydrogenase C-terminal domain-containing protein [Acidithiobacillales bacterium]